MIQGYDQWNAFGGMNFDLGLTDEDLEFLDCLNRPGPPQQHYVVQEQPAQQYVHNDTESPNDVDANAVYESPTG